MDIFDVLTAIVKRKLELMLSGINEHEALMNAEIDVSEEYHISLLDIKKLIERGLNNNESTSIIIHFHEFYCLPERFLSIKALL